ncbi:unnamed protein product [Heligmosomoides polygyrus]|uniref:ANK_REP_REGION domain-containing protein n=1 Tax=Heligmosomoides polygyrus TaxID=6339 RepID=A0A183GNK7_HELPZ|nr:unnamed protein product [Heligmosomoides polygyrus]
MPRNRENIEAFLLSSLKVAQNVPPPKETVTVGVNTGPVPPAKPCAECGPLRKELQELLKRLTLAETKPTVVSVSMSTDIVPTVEAAVGETTLCYSIGTETDHNDTVECGCDALGVESQSTECQTTTAVMTEIGVGVETSVADVDLQTDDQLTPRTHFGVNTDEVEKPPEVEKADQATVTEEIPASKAEVVDQETMTIPKYFRNIPSQTIALEEVVEDREVILPTESPTTAASSDAECQTETVQLLCYHTIGTETDHNDTVECGCDALGVESQSTECQTTTAVMTDIGVGVETSVADVDLQTDDQLTPRTHFGVNTDEVEKPPEVEKSDQATVTEEIPALKAEVVDQETMTIPKYFRNIPSQTIALEEVVEDREVILPTESPTTAASSDAECQTETDSTVDSTASDDVAGDAAVVTNCPRCRQREETFTRNVGVGACSVADKVCIECDKASPEEVDENDAPGFKVEKDETRSKDFDRARAVAVKKLLTSEQKQPFVRGTAVSRSARIERNKGDHLEYITEKNKSSSVAPPTPATTPSGETADALKSKVVLKKEIPVPPSNLPEPVPARIPRPKISKYAVPAENAETPDEEEEAADRLTPLRSELRSLGR